MFINEQVIIQMQEVLKVAADSTRIKIMSCLLDEFDVTSENDKPTKLVEKCVNDIALQIGASQSLVSHQLKVLKEGDFVKSNKIGTKIYYSLKDEHVREILKITYEHVLERWEEQND